MDHTTSKNAPTRFQNQTQMLQVALSEEAQMSERVQGAEPKVEVVNMC